MQDLFRLFDPDGFPPRWTCGTGWTRPLGWSHIGSDVAIALAYFAVPCIVLHFVSRQRDVRLPQSFWILFTLIFVSCGLVHLFESVIFWWPVYRFSAVLKAVTAGVSLSGVVLLVRVLPTALSLKHPEELRREVAERERAETELNEERFLLNTLLDQLPDMIYFKDAQGKFIRISRALAGRLGLSSPREAVGRSDFDFFPAKYADSTYQDELALMASREAVIGKEEQPRWPDGSESWVSTTKSPLISADGLLLGTIGISHDVTELKAKEAALLKSEERYELAVRGSTDGLWDWDVTSDVVYYSPRFKELLGFDEEEFPNRFESFEARLHPADRSATLAAVQGHLQHRIPYDVEYRLQTKAGPYRWYRSRGQAVWNDEGRPCRMAGSITDITDRRQAEERFRLAVEASPSGMLIVDEQGQILLANTQIESLFGYTREELSHIVIEELVPASARPAHVRHRVAWFEDPQPRSMGSRPDLLGRRRDGSVFDVQIGLSPIRSEQGLTVLCSVLDVTEQKKNIRALEEARQVAEAASRAK
ncbi:MAG: PAS domain S-box protein, partial [Planctomycetaceae bacterium]|nr:PAS domain S-box protein [Planctomycetaceae bacterium]